MSLLFEERIALNLMKLNDVEDDIIEYLKKVENRDKTIRQVANELYIVPNTIFRLAKKLGYSGYAQMKFALDTEVYGKQEEQLRQINRLYEPEISRHIIKTIKLIDKKAIKLLIQKISGANTVVSFAQGDTKFFSELLVKYLRSGEKYNTENIRILCDSEYSISRLHENDVVILISVSGESVWIHDLARLARRQKAFIVGITMNSKNTLRTLVDMSLTFSSEDIDVDNFIAPDLTGLMILIRFIANTYWNTYLRDRNESAQGDEKKKV